MTPISEQQLAAELRAMRSTPRPEFAAELDQAVADGFPDPRSPKAWIVGAGEKLRAVPPRRWLVPAGGVALAAIAIATAVIAIGGEGDAHNPVAFERQTQTPATPEHQHTSGGSAAAQYEDALPESASSASGVGAPNHSSASGEFRGHEDTSGRQFPDALPSAGRSAPRTGPYAAGASHRDVERAAQIVLAAAPSEVRDDAAQVFEAVHAADGIVLSSSVRDGRAGQAGARFELLIPSAKLSDAMASFSSIATVHVRHESSQDITAPTVSAAERLQDAEASVRGLLGQLAEADSDAARAAAEAELRAARAKAAAIRSGLSTLERRDNLSRVSLRIESRDGGASTGEGGGPWGFGDGLHGAGRVLAVAAGVTVIAAALLAPLALLGLLAWLARGAWIRRARRHALE